MEHPHDDQAVLVVDETGDVNKGTGTFGVQRQHTGTAGRIENAQVAVYLVYTGRRGHAAVDRELYVPRSWTSDPDRCRAAGLGEETAFATKPEQHRRTRLPPLLLAHTGAADHAGASRWIKMASRGVLPIRKGPGRPERASGPPVRVLVPLGHPGHARHALLAVVRADEHTRRPARDALIPLTCNEIQRLFIALVVQPVHDVAHRLGWSAWRRRHQARSQASHYQRQAAQA